VNKYYFDSDNRLFFYIHHQTRRSRQNKNKYFTNPEVPKSY